MRRFPDHIRDQFLGTTATAPQAVAHRDPAEPGYLDRRIAEEAGPVVTYRLDELPANGGRSLANGTVSPANGRVSARRTADPDGYDDRWPLSKAALQRLVDEGLTNDEIAERYGVSRAALSVRLARLGIKRTPEQKRAIHRAAAERREQRRRQLEAALAAPLPPPAAASVPSPADAQAAVLAAIARTAALIPGGDPVVSDINARTLETLVRVYRALAAPIREGAA